MTDTPFHEALFRAANDLLEGQFSAPYLIAATAEEKVHIASNMTARESVAVLCNVVAKKVEEEGAIDESIFRALLKTAVGAYGGGEKLHYALIVESPDIADGMETFSSVGVDALGKVLREVLRQIENGTAEAAP